MRERDLVAPAIGFDNEVPELYSDSLVIWTAIPAEQLPFSGMGVAGIPALADCSGLDRKSQIET